MTHMTRKKVFKFDLTSVGVVDELKWSESASIAMDEGMSKGSIMDADIPGYGVFGLLTSAAISEIALRIERAARYRAAESELLRVELLTRELNGAVEQRA